MTKPEIFCALTTSMPRQQIAALSVEQKADLAYRALGSVADALAERGIELDLVARAALDLGSKLDPGTPARVVQAA